ncbi:hypothetical protein [Bartonella quintana]|uniref:Uncharacterized protein n=1 Tax=Bartonella quintana JK 73 TaxID=1402976 RepID=W3U1I5_BARQI|nr:hypothetical protein [Bartonella quintana]ETS14818.1 hypothetical protein Q650_00205 [Bartonella quintana JK 73rel]ETS16658.1 hypothetical protein Q649_00214 [Bartonella quintana JK 73]SQF96814.1 Uncharacterised protein [Bartonella quintana]
MNVAFFVRWLKSFFCALGRTGISAFKREGEQCNTFLAHMRFLGEDFVAILIIFSHVLFCFFAVFEHRMVGVMRMVMPIIIVWYVFLIVIVLKKCIVKMVFMKLSLFWIEIVDRGRKMAKGGAIFMHLARENIHANRKIYCARSF